MLQKFLDCSVVVTGRSGCGKSILARAVASLRPHGLVIDSVGDFRMGKPIRDIREIANVCAGGWWSIPVGLVEHPEATVRAAVGFIKRVGIRGLLPKPYTVVVEEADVYGGPAWNMQELTELSNFGRHFQCTTIINAHAISSCPKTWFVNAGIVLYGFTGDFTDLKNIEKRLGPEDFSTYKYEIRDFLFLAKDTCGDASLMWYAPNDKQICEKRIERGETSHGRNAESSVKGQHR